MTTKFRQAVSSLIPERLRKVTAGLRAGKKPERVSEYNGAHELTVRLLEQARPPVTSMEKLTIKILKESGPMPFSALVERLARETYFSEVRNGAWTVDIGLFGPDIFAPDVAARLTAGDGILWIIGKPEYGILPDRT